MRQPTTPIPPTVRGRRMRGGVEIFCDHLLTPPPKKKKKKLGHPFRRLIPPWKTEVRAALGVGAPAVAEGGEGLRMDRVWAAGGGGVVCRVRGTAHFAGSEWDLGHDDNDRSRYHGPEHRRCNRGIRAAGFRGCGDRGLCAAIGTAALHRSVSRLPTARPCVRRGRGAEWPPSTSTFRVGTALNVGIEGSAARWRQECPLDP